MAITALYSAASGMRALDTKLDVLANNLANVNTVGFKRSRTNFEDLLYDVRREPGIRNAEDEPIPHGIEVGLGATVSGTQLNFAPGSVDTTGPPLDMMIQGEGSFRSRPSIKVRRSPPTPAPATSRRMPRATSAWATRTGRRSNRPFRFRMMRRSRASRSGSTDACHTKTLQGNRSLNWGRSSWRGS